MTRRKIQIKKIDNTTARQVTFSKRRRGLFKKAQELSTLCDAEIALVVFSATGKLFEFTSSSVQQVIERHHLLSSDFDKLNHPSLELQSFCMSQLESSTSAALSKEIAEKTHELRKLRGEELQELNMKELQELEKLLGSGLRRVRDAKCEIVLKEITSLKWKGSQLMQENKRLKQMENRQVQTLELEQGQSSEPIGDFIHSDPSQDHDSSDISLKLGLAFPSGI
ncbi:PREDICTED: MADS-box protein SVP-like isoform X2 [Prunus mume]|uniref:MADS-box protein SVP-like isoform X2 n=1 Tax=Prunus mume TaxID=102107 RepID=A0ABM0PBF8_PRUMU|nr:PREDICTED: MADS-box protein SVP-like isoform X2 [Prunus mume]